MAKPRVERNLLFVDSETTGLDDSKHEMLEVAGLLTTPDGQEVLKEFEFKLRPVRLEMAEPDALRINGYNETDWAPDKCTAPSDVVSTIASHASNAILVGQNVAFDEGFLKAFFRTHNVKTSWHYHKVDTMNLAWPLFCQRKIDYFNLDSLCDFCKVDRPPVHRAMADVKATRAVYLQLMKLLAPV